uniref:uncharacterized protein LOC120338482 n=1 Tax=Styela clava TaxID=7725 RepID=UPI00193A895D|nr:uncharacterized protein LOC120338482 [Styela clava]
MPKAIEKLNDITKKHTVFYDEARGTFEKQLNVEVNPQLKEIDFFGKHTAPQDDYTPESANDRDDGDGGVNVGSLIELKDLLEQFEKGHITFVGGAGYGKTTLLKAISRGALDGRYMKNVNAIHFMQCAPYLPNKLITARELIFGSTLKDLSDEEVTQIIEDIKSNPDGFVFVLDSLDSLQYDLDGVYEYINDVNEEANPEAILWNFLAGNLFPGSRIITSSREHSIRNYKGEVRPQKVVALTGLTKDSIKEIIVGYLGEKKGNETMHYLKSECPDQLAYCSTPVLLVYTLVALQDGSEEEKDPQSQRQGRSKPSTISGITVSVLQSIMRSDHVTKEKSSEDVLEIFNKLKALAHNGCSESKVHFAEEDFRHVGLDRSDAVSISIITLRGGRGSILQGNDLLFFSHQSLQEMLSAFFICEMNIDDFTTFVAQDLDKPRFRVVRRFLCGVLMDDDLFQQAEQMLIHEITNVEEKKKILRDFFTKELRRPNLEGADLLEIILSLHECREGIDAVIKENLYRINLENFPLSPGDCHALGSVISRCNVFDDLDIQNCSINDESINILSSVLEKSRLKNYELWIGLNTDLGVEGYSTMGRWCKNCVIDKLHLYRSDMKPDQLDALLDTMKNNKISLLVLHGNTNMGIRGMKTIKKMAAQCGLEKLDMQNCRLTTAQLQELSNMPPNTKFNTLRLNEKRAVSKEDVQALVDLLPRVTDTLSLFGWKISNDDFLMLETKKPEGLKIDMKGSHADGVEESEGYIDPRGFQMKIGTCRVRFQRNTVEKPTFFQVLATINPGNEPEGYFTITPRITCNPPINFNVPMTVKLPTWCRTESDDVIAYVMYKDKGQDATCQILERKNLKDCGRQITFESAYHMYFWVSIDKNSLNKVTYSAHISVYYAQSGRFKAVLYTGGKPDVDAEMRKKGFNKVDADFETKKIAITNKLSLTFACKFPGQEVMTFGPESKEYFLLGENFALTRRSTVDFKLQSLPNPGQYLKITSTLSDGESLVTDLLWSGEESSSTSQSSLETEEEVHFTKSTEKHIDKEGEIISLNGNRIIFPDGALDQKTNIKLSVDSDPSHWPSQFVLISTILNCDLSGSKLNKPVRVEMETWCTTYHGEAEILVLKKKDNDTTWKVEKTAKLGTSGTVGFETKGFSLCSLGYYVKTAYMFLRELLGIPIKYHMTNLLYYNNDATFTSIVCKRDTTILNEIRENMSRGNIGIEFMTPALNFISPPGSQIRIAISCSQPLQCEFVEGDSGDEVRIDIEPPKRRKESFTEIFVDQVMSNMWKQKYFNLQPKPDDSCNSLEIGYSVIVNSETPELHSIRNRWPAVLPTPPPAPVIQGNYVNYGSGQININKNEGQNILFVSPQANVQ